jgi:hypothetical protein
MIAIGAQIYGNPEALRVLRRDCMSEHLLLDGRVVVGWRKGRANREQRRSFLRDRSFSVPHLIDHVGGVARYRRFESGFLQRGVACEPKERRIAAPGCRSTRRTDALLRQQDRGGEPDRAAADNHIEHLPSSPNFDHILN